MPSASSAIEKPGVPRVGDVRAGLDDESRANPGHHGRQAAQMIGVGVGDDGERERPGAVALQERRDHASPGIGPFARGPGIDHAANARRESGARRHPPARRRENVT